jgi:hypothetical protein
MFMMLISTVSQIERQFWSPEPEPRSGIVLAIKLALFAISLLALAQCIREIHRPRAPTAGAGGSASS